MKKMYDPLIIEKDNSNYLINFTWKNIGGSVRNLYRILEGTIWVKPYCLWYIFNFSDMSFRWKYIFLERTIWVKPYCSFLINFWTPKNIWDLGGNLYYILERTIYKICERTIYIIIFERIWVELYGLLVRIC